MTKLIIHCGAHKTATSSLQQLLAHSGERLAGVGVNYLRPEQINQAAAFPARPNQALDSKRIADLRKLFEAVARGRGDRHWVRDPERVLISHESILSFVGLGPKSASFYPDIERSADRLRECGLEEVFDSVELIFFVRRQDHFVVSLYLQHLSRADWRAPFEEMFPRLDVSKMNWHAVAGRIEAAFPTARLVVRPFEMLKSRGERAFLNEFMTLATGRDDLGFEELPRVNESFSSKAYEIATRYYGNLERESAQLLAQTLARVFPTSRSGKPKLLTAEQSIEVLRAVRDSNIALFRDYLPSFSELEEEYILRDAARA